MEAALKRIADAAGVPDILQLLADRLSPTDLQSLMLAVYRRRSERRSPAEVLADYEQSRFFGASELPWSGFVEWTEIALREAGSFEFLTLAPMAPLASCAAVAAVGQDWSIPTARTGEVVSDPTNVLALELALRRKRAPGGALHLATVQRVVRPQAFGNSRMLAHFSLLALASGDRDAGSYRTDAAMIERHLDALLRMTRAFLGPALPLSLSYTIRSGSHADARLESFRTATARHGVPVWEESVREAVDSYYCGFCFHLWADLPEGRRQLADGGSVDWLGKLTNNRKERAFISGAGVDGMVALRSSR